MSCEGLTGEELRKCKSIHSDSPVWATRLIGLLALLFGVLIIWQPSFIVWLLGGLLIMAGLLVLITQKTYLLPIIMIIAGGGILLYPSFLLYVILVMALVIGFVVALQEPRTPTKTGLGIAVAVMGLLIWLMPSLMATLIGISLIFVGIVVLVGGNIGEIPIAGGEWKRLRGK